MVSNTSRMQSGITYQVAEAKITVVTGSGEIYTLEVGPPLYVEISRVLSPIGLDAEGGVESEPPSYTIRVDCQNLDVFREESKPQHVPRRKRVTLSRFALLEPDSKG